LIYNWHEHRTNTKAHPCAHTKQPDHTGFRISDEFRAVLQLLLPVHVNTHRFGGGRPRVPDHQCADAIFYVLRAVGGAERDRSVCKSTAYDRFRAWVAAGVFLKLWQVGVEL
jgi:transposase